MKIAIQCKRVGNGVKCTLFINALFIIQQIGGSVFAVVVVAAEDSPHQTGKRLITKCICVVQIDVLASKIVLQDQR